MMLLRARPRTATAAAVALALLVTACGDDDGSAVRDGGSVEVIDGGSSSGSASGSASASASAPASGSSPSTVGDAGYEYVSNVNAHRLVVADVCDVAEALDADPVDFAAAADVYRNGKHSVNSDGSLRTLAGFATATDRSHGIDAFYGTPTPIHDFVTAALDGTGAFDGTADAVRAQGVEKGIQNQLMVAWVLHELAAALDKADAGNFDPDDGAPHNWDEAWAFYAGAEPSCAPYATADKRGADFGTTDDGVSAANAAILAAMIEGRDALVAGDAAAAEAAADEVRRNLVITYSQATLKYATLVPVDVADGDLDAAEVHRAEGYVFWRVVEPLVVPAGADGEAVNAVLDLDGVLGEQGGADEVRAALRPAWDALGITDDEIGALS